MADTVIKVSVPEQEKKDKRGEEMANAIADKAPPHLAKILRALAPFVGMIQAFLEVVWPYLCKMVQLIYKLYNLCPTDLFHAALGFVLCFAGGLYPTLFAAIEAARLCGWDRTSKAIDDLWAQAANLKAAN